MYRWAYLLCLCLALAPAPALAVFIWWEAEGPERTDFPPLNPFAPEDEQQADALSAGAWIGADGDGAEGLFLEYSIDVPVAGTYAFYVRKFWKHGPFRWRFDEGPWGQVGRDVALLDAVELRQFIVANWVAVGAVDLAAGGHTLRLEVLEAGAVAFDAFLLTTETFVPRGRLKPGEKLGRAREGYFPFEPDPDPFTAAALLDLRFLNEGQAGEHGVIRAAEGGFVHDATGAPVRFWGVNAGPDLWRMDRASVDYLARHLAKLGVNAVRLHGPVFDPADLSSADARRVADILYFVHAMKREGIYSGLSIYFPLWMELTAAQGFAGYDGEVPFALLFFDPTLQRYYMNWWRTLLTTPGPDSGLTLAQDPAVAMAELVNEDGYFFWTFTPYDNIPAPAMAVLERQFSAWLEERYGSPQAALDLWGPPLYRGDREGEDRVGLMPARDLASRTTRRARDTVEFLTLHQRAFYARMKAFLQQELGYGGMVSASNWITAEGRKLGPLDKYANTVGDFMDRHGYFAPQHDGARAAWSLSVGDRYADRRALTFQAAGRGGTAPQFDNPVMDLQYNGLPSIISEIGWPMPNRFRADMPLLSAAYGALQGSDGFFFFALSGATWQQAHTKFSLQTPVGAGQFPAAALIYRLGLVARATPVYDVHLPLSRLLALKGAPVRAPQNLDRLRAADIPAGGTLAGGPPPSLDPLAFLVGPVGLSISAGEESSLERDLRPFIDRDAQRVRSATGELLWDYGTGVVTVDAPAVQGVTGFLRAAGPVRLQEITIESPLEYGSIVVVALDGASLASSQHLLLQVMSEEENDGWQTAGRSTRRIDALGGPPLIVRNLQGRVTFHNGGNRRVIALDFNGYPADTLDAGDRIDLRPRTIYYVIEAGEATAVAEEEGSTLPGAFGLGQNYPNPFNGGTVIPFALSSAATVELGVYNLAGQQVASLLQGRRAAGTYTVVWDGRDGAGRELGSGVYLCDLRAGGQRQRRKMVLLR